MHVSAQARVGFYPSCTRWLNGLAHHIYKNFLLHIIYISRVIVFTYYDMHTNKVTSYIHCYIDIHIVLNYSSNKTFTLSTSPFIKYNAR